MTIQNFSARIATPLDAVRALPRTVTGFHVVIETGMEVEDMRASLEGMAERSAFRLVGIAACGRAETGAALHCCEFALAATHGMIGDPQIFALLRDVSARHRWNGLEKRLAR